MASPARLEGVPAGQMVTRGTFVEVVGDMVFRVCPLNAPDARQMIAEMKDRVLPRGYRGAPRWTRRHSARRCRSNYQITSTPYFRKTRSRVTRGQRSAIA